MSFTNIVPPTPIMVSYVGTVPFTASALQQRQFFTDYTNPKYVRHATMTQDGVYLQIGTASVIIPFANLYAVAANALPQLNWPPVIVTQPTSSTVTNPAPVYFYVSSSVPQYAPNATVAWYSSSYSQSFVGSASLLTNTGIFSGVTTNTLALAITNVSLSLSQFFAVETNASGQTTSSLALLTVN